MSLVLALGAWLLPPLMLTFAGTDVRVVIPVGLLAAAMAIAGVVAGHLANSLSRPSRRASAVLGLCVGYLWLVLNVGSVVVLTLFGEQIVALLRQSTDALRSDLKSP
ncbi:MAG: hypothetical protein Q8L48_33735 [Archangium sp.]|nr:hypothetical protein [Archangium sp.]